MEIKEKKKELYRKRERERERGGETIERETRRGEAVQKQQQREKGLVCLCCVVSCLSSSPSSSSSLPFLAFLSFFPNRSRVSVQLLPLHFRASIYISPKKFKYIKRLAKKKEPQLNCELIKREIRTPQQQIDQRKSRIYLSQISLFRLATGFDPSFFLSSAGSIVVVMRFLD